MNKEPIIFSILWDLENLGRPNCEGTQLGFQELERYFFFNPKLARFYTRSVQFASS